MGQSQSTQSRSTKAGPRLKGESHETADTSTTAAEPASSSPRNRRQTISRRFQLKGRRRRQNTETQRSLREAMEQQRQAETMLADLKQERDRRPSGPQLALGSNGGLEGLCIVVGEASTSVSRQASPESSTGGTTNGNSQTVAGRASAGTALDASRLLALPDTSTMSRSLGDRSSTPGLSTSSSTNPSSPCLDQPTPKSHWSESSVGIPTPQLPFQSFRDSLNLNRLSQLFPSGTSFSATPSSPRSPDMERLSDACTSDDKVVAQRGEQSKRRKTGAGRPQIVIVDAQPVGAKRYSQMMAAEEALQEELGTSERKGSTGGASIATIRPNGTRKASVISTAGSVDVWDSDIPWPGMRQVRTSTPDVALSPRFSTTPAFLAQAECLDDSLRRASDRRNTYKRRSSTLDLSGYVAASPELAFPPATASLTSLVSSSPSPPLPPKPFRRLSQMRAPAGHPASHHLRFSRASSTFPSSPRSSSSARTPRMSPLTAGVPAEPNSPSLTLAVPSPRRSSAGAPLAWRGRLDSVAETATSSARGDEVPVRLGPGASRRRSSVRRLTNCTSASDVSFPHSIGTEDAESSRSPTFPVTATPSPICRDLPPLPTSTSGIDFSGYTLGKPTPRPVSCISTGSDLPPELVDAFPAPPLPPSLPLVRPRVPAKLDLSRQARDSILTATASSPRSLPSHASTPSTSSFASSLTSQASIDLGPKPAGPVVSVEFGAAALAGKTYRPPSSAGSVATFVLEDIIDELNSLHVEEAKGGAPGRCERLLSLEQPDPHLAEHLAPTVVASTIVPQARSPPRFQAVFSLDKPISTSKPLPALVSPLSHALLDESRYNSPHLAPPTPDSPRLATDKLHDLPPSVPASLEPSPVPPQKYWTSRPRIASADAAHRSPSQQVEARRDTYPTFVPPSQRTQQPNLFDALLEQASRADEKGGKSGGGTRERRLGSKDKRGFDKADIGAWLDRARRESEEHARMRRVVRV